MRIIYCILVGILGNAALDARAAELRDVVVEREDGRYYLRSETIFESNRDTIYEILTNFDLFEKFTSAIVESANVEPDEKGRPQFYARMEGCVLLWCRSFIRNGYVETRPQEEIIAISDPERSDFKFSRERWELSPHPDGTMMIYEFEMEPAFWVPPVIGPFYIKRALASGGAKVVDRIEAMAKTRLVQAAEDSEKVVQSPGGQ